MKKAIKALLCVGAIALSFSVMNRPVYAYSEINALGMANISTDMLRLNGLDFNYSKYSKETIQDLVSYLESMRNEDDSLQYEYFEFEARFALETYEFTGGELVHPLYVLSERLEYAIDNSDSSTLRKESKKLLKEVKSDIVAHENQLKIQNLLKSREDLVAFRNEQIVWSDLFLSMFDPEFDWTKKSFSIKSIDIYEFFSDGKYCAPVENQSLELISTKYSDNHYGMAINMYEGDNVYSIANNATVKVSFNEVRLILDTGAEVIYRNLKTDLENGDVVNKGDLIGVYKQRSHDYNGLYISLVKNNKEYSCEWLMTEYPFITNEGMSMPLYRQGDELWSEMAFGTSTIGPSGCGPSALSMAISYLKNEIITPADVVTHIGGADTWYYCHGKGSYWSLIDDCPEMYGLKCRRISTSEVIDELEKGNPIIAIMGPGQFTNGGHFITLSGVDEDGRIYVNDSADNWEKQHFNQTFTLSSIANECSCFWVVYK